MKLPPWKSDDLDDQRALSRFVIAELDRMDGEAGNAGTLDGETMHRLGTLATIQRLAERIGYKLNLPTTKPPKLASEDASDFDRAAHDVPRIKLIFQRHWKRRNRYQRPLAEEIAAERWELTADERNSLIDKFQRKSAVPKD